MDQLKKLRNTPVSELMTENVVIIDGSKMVSEAIALMKENETTAIVVKPRNDDDTFGVVTDKDILEKVIDPGEETYADPWNTQVHQIMSKPVISCNPAMRVKYALRLMKQLRLRQLLVLNGDKAVGIISEVQILKAVQNLPVNNQTAL